MKQGTMITREAYLPLAKKFWEVVEKEYSTDLTIDQVGVVLGAVECMKQAVVGMLEEHGHKFIIVNEERE